MLPIQDELLLSYISDLQTGWITNTLKRQADALALVPKQT
jgi:hypothetical protein